MRVLLITDWNRGRGGAEAYMGWLRDGLRAAGDEVRLLTSSAGSAADGSADYVAYGTERLAAQVLLQIVNPFAVATVRRAVRAFRPDVVLVNMFAHHLSPAILGALRAIPTVLLVSDYKCICPIGSKLRPDGTLCATPAGWVCCRAGCVSLPHWLRDQPRYAVIRSAVRRVDRVLACSRWLERELARDDIASEVIPLPVPAPGPQFRRTLAGEPLFVFCGRLDVEKGVALLLHALARVRASGTHARLRIIGRGAERSALERLASRLGLGAAVTFTGWLDPSQVERHLADVWALVAPSLWGEPLGLVAIEAIVRGVPVIASASGGLAETVEDGVSGLLFANGDQTALAERMQAVARRVAFPSLVVPSDTRLRVMEQHAVVRHVEHMRAVFTQLTARRATPRVERDS